MRHTQLAALIALMSCLGASACGSLLGIGDLPGLDGGAGSDSGIDVALGGEGGPTDGGPAKGSGGDTGPEGEAGRASDSEVTGSDASADLEASIEPDASEASSGVSPDASADVFVIDAASSVEASAADATADAAVDAMPSVEESTPDAANVEAPDVVTGVCTFGATQCTSNTQIETCGSDGQWGTVTACANIESLCCNGLFPPSAGATPIAKSLVGGYYWYGPDGSAKAVGMTCGTATEGTCDESADECTGTVGYCLIACLGITETVGGTCGGTCLPGSTQCAAESVETCGSDGQWGSGVACSSGCSGGACLP
jgi:hypothetical protein